MPRPHGGKLIDRHIKKELSDIEEFPVLEVSTNLAEDIENIADGVFSPLTGFLCKNDLENVLNEKRLVDDTPWTIPILLDFDRKEFKNINEGDTVLLENKETGLLSTLNIEEIYTINKKALAKSVYGTTDMSHPGVANVYNTKSHMNMSKKQH